MTGLVDQQFRARAYGMGVDLFIGKPQSTEETKQFMDCIESLLDLEAQDRAGFRGVQNKSLVDIIQLECLCKSSAVLRIHNETDEGRIWFQDGEIVDAEVPSLGGEDAFRRILSWKTGNFEILPADAGRTRKIENSYQGLLLSSAQALDEAQSVPGGVRRRGRRPRREGTTPPAMPRGGGGIRLGTGKRHGGARRLLGARRRGRGQPLVAGHRERFSQARRRSARRRVPAVGWDHSATTVGRAGTG